MGTNTRCKNIFGSTQYIDLDSKISIIMTNNKWYASLDGVLFDAGFYNIACAIDFFNNIEYVKESLSMLGYFQVDQLFINDSNPGFLSELSILDEGVFEVRSIYSDGRNPTLYRTYRSKNFNDIEHYILKLFDTYHIDIFDSVILSNNNDVKYVIEAKMSSRDLSKNLVRVKSSNLWSYGINIKDAKDSTGDVIVQFKGKDGGPGDIYQYFDVPVKIWRRWIGAPSKGSFHWRYIRNKYKYRKLTGDKKGKLPNAIN